jgi:hypothetical protein
MANKKLDMRLGDVSERERFVNALAPDHQSQAAYTGRIKQTETVIIHAEDGTPIQKEVTFYISWDSISQLLALARKRAGLQS